MVTNFKGLGSKLLILSAALQGGAAQTHCWNGITLQQLRAVQDIFNIQVIGVVQYAGCSLRGADAMKHTWQGANGMRPACCVQVQLLLSSDLWSTVRECHHLPEALSGWAWRVTCPCHGHPSWQRCSPGLGAGTAGTAGIGDAALQHTGRRGEQGQSSWRGLAALQPLSPGCSNAPLPWLAPGTRWFLLGTALLLLPTILWAPCRARAGGIPGQAGCRVVSAQDSALETNLNRNTPFTPPWVQRKGHFLCRPVRLMALIKRPDPAGNFN